MCVLDRTEELLTSFTLSSFSYLANRVRGMEPEMKYQWMQNRRARMDTWDGMMDELQAAEEEQDGFPSSYDQHE